MSTILSRRFVPERLVGPLGDVELDPGLNRLPSLRRGLKVGRPEAPSFRVRKTRSISPFRSGIQGEIRFQVRPYRLEHPVSAFDVKAAWLSVRSACRDSS